MLSVYIGNRWISGIVYTESFWKECRLSLKVLIKLSVYIGIEEILEHFRIVLEAMQA